MLRKGQVLDNRYQIHTVLGEGGFGAVYKVWDDNLQRFCAIKENLQASLESQKQFKREAIMLASLNHPHLVRVTDYLIIPDQGQYLVMDYVEGDDLQTILTDNGGPLPSEQALAWIRQICDALIYIHNQDPPIIHRDIKPANIRLTPQGNAVLVDFGLAKNFGEGVQTLMGARGLTPHFAAPEQYGTGGTDAQSDIYSLGVTLYCLLTYSVPPDSVEIMVGNAEPPPAARMISRNIADSVSAALQRAMQIRRTDRYKSVSDFKNALLAEQKPLVVKPSFLANDVILEKSLPNQKPKPSVVVHESKEEVHRKAGDAKALNDEANSLYFLGRYEDAIRYCDKALEIDPRYVSALYNKGDCLNRLDRHEDAIRCYDQALEIDPRDVYALFYKGYSLQSLDRYEEAIRYFDKAVEIDPRHVSALHNKGYSLQSLDRHEEAIRYFDKALEIDPRDVDALYNKALSLDTLGRYEEAIRCLDKVLEIDPRDVDALYSKALSLDDLGRKREATVSYRKFLALAPAQYANQIEHARQRIRELEGG